MILLLAPFAAAPLFRPLFLLPLLPCLAVNLLASHPFLHSGRFHYEAELYPLLFCLLIVLSRDPVFLARWRRLVAGGLGRRLPGLGQLSFRSVWLALFLTFFSGKAASWYVSAYPRTDLQASIADRLAAWSPTWSGARVAAFETIAPHLSSVRNLYLLDRWADADWIVMAYPYAKDGWMTHKADFETRVVPELDRRFELVYVDHVYPLFRIWRRKP
jgi:hypothetical protein